MPLQPIPESTKQGTATAKPSTSIRRSAATLAPFLALAGEGTPPGVSILPFAGGETSGRPGVTRPGTLPQITPQDLAPGMNCPPGCVTAEQAGANTWGGLVVGALVSGAAGALGGFLLARWIK